MQKFILLAGLSLATIAHADDKQSTPTAATSSSIAPSMIAPAQAKKTPWLSGLKEPQGLAFDARGNILLADYGAGKVLRYSREGKLLGTLAEGLKNPTQIVVGSKIVPSKSVRGSFEQVETIYVSERKANRVIQILPNGKVVPVGGAIEEPLGLARDTTGGLYVVAHTTSKIYRWDGAKWNLVFAAPLEDGDEERYGYRNLVFDNGAFLMTDEVGEQVLILTGGGRLATWATGIGDPSGIVIAPNGATYVTDESEGGRLYRVNNLGEKTIVAEGLGRPRGILFLDAKTALVSDRGGKVWKLVLP